MYFDNQYKLKLFFINNNFSHFRIKELLIISPCAEKQLINDESR